MGRHIDRETRIDRVLRRQWMMRAREDEMDEAEQEKIRRHLVGDAQCCRRPLPQHPAVIVRHPPRVFAVEAAVRHLGQRSALLAPERQLASGRDRWMARNDLFDQCRAGLDHADDQDGNSLFEPRSAFNAEKESVLLVSISRSIFCRRVACTIDHVPREAQALRSDAVGFVEMTHHIIMAASI